VANAPLTLTLDGFGPRTNGIDPETKQLVITDIYNHRDGKMLLPTGYLPSFVESLIQKDLLKLEFLYGATEPTNGVPGTSKAERRQAAPPPRPSM